MKSTKWGEGFVLAPSYQRSRVAGHEAVGYIISRVKRREQYFFFFFEIRSPYLGWLGTGCVGRVGLELLEVCLPLLTPHPPSWD